MPGRRRFEAVGREFLEEFSKVRGMRRDFSGDLSKVRGGMGKGGIVGLWHDAWKRLETRVIVRIGGESCEEFPRISRRCSGGCPRVALRRRYTMEEVFERTAYRLHITLRSSSGTDPQITDPMILRQIKAG
jgi:hypothetical protein